MSSGEEGGACTMHDARRTYVVFHSSILSFFSLFHLGFLGANKWNGNGFHFIRSVDGYSPQASSFCGHDKATLHTHLVDLGPHQHYPRWNTKSRKIHLRDDLFTTLWGLHFLSDPFCFGNVSASPTQRGGCLASVPWQDVMLFVLDLTNLTMLWKMHSIVLYHGFF